MSISSCLLTHVNNKIIDAVTEARADEARKCAADVCGNCGGRGDSRHFLPAERKPSGEWGHKLKEPTPHLSHKYFKCFASAIHERLHREAQEIKQAP